MQMSVLRSATPERLNAFSDGVFAVLITVLVLDLRPPEAPTFEALLKLWPNWLSYAVSYLFIAIVWVNHHYLLRFAEETTSRLLWFNFAHLFSMSLLPLDRLDGGEQARAAPGRLLCRSLFSRQRDLHCPDLGACGRDCGWRGACTGAPGDALSCHHHFVLVCGGCDRGIEIPGRRTRDLRLLPDRLSKTRSARHGRGNRLHGLTLPAAESDSWLLQAARLSAAAPARASAASPFREG
jgi:hypothetical protein